MKTRALLRHHAERVTRNRLGVLLEVYRRPLASFRPGYLASLKKRNLTCSCRTCRGGKVKPPRIKRDWLAQEEA